MDEKNKNVILTEKGSKQIEKILNVQDLYDRKDPWIPYIINALKADALFFKNVDYIVQNKENEISQSNDARSSMGRRFTSSY